MGEEKIRAFYESALKHYKLPDFETFKADMQDENKRSAFYNSAINKYKLPDYNTFSSDMMVSPQVSTPTKEDQPSLNRRPYFKPIEQYAEVALAGLKDLADMGLDVGNMLLESGIGAGKIISKSSSPMGMAQMMSEGGTVEGATDLAKNAYNFPADVLGLNYEKLKTSELGKRVASKLEARQQLTPEEQNYVGSQLLVQAPLYAGGEMALAKAVPKLAGLPASIVSGAGLDVVTSEGDVSQRAKTALAGAVVGGGIGLITNKLKLIQKIKEINPEIKGEDASLIAKEIIDETPSGVNESDVLARMNLLDQYKEYKKSDLFRMANDLSESSGIRIDTKGKGRLALITQIEGLKLDTDIKLRQGEFSFYKDFDLKKLQSEAKNLGIDTKSKSQIELIKELEKQNYRQINGGQNATEIGKISENNQPEYQNGNEARQTTETGNSNSTIKSEGEQAGQEIGQGQIDAIDKKVTDNWWKRKVNSKLVTGDNFGTWQEARDIYTNANSYQSSLNWEIMRNAKDLESVVRKATKGETESLSPLINDVLIGNKNITELPKSVQERVQASRDLIDRNTETIKQFVDPKLQETLSANIGKYLRRSFSLFVNNESYLKTLVKDGRLIRENKVVQDAIEGVKRDWNLTDNQAEVAILNMIDKGNADNFLYRGSNIFGKDVSSLMKKNSDLPQYILDLYGEIKDPYINLIETGRRQAQMIAFDKAQKDLVESGIRLGFIKKEADPLNRIELGSDSNARTDNFKGLYTTPEIKEAITKQFNPTTATDDVNKILKYLYGANIIAKTTKTVFNPISYAPNFIGGVTQNLAGGVAMDAIINPLKSYKDFRKGIESVFTNYGYKTDQKEVVNEFKRMIELGVLRQNVSLSEITKLADQSVASKAFKKITTPIFEAYNSPDEINKVARYLFEKRSYQDAYEKAYGRKLTADELAKIEVDASQRTQAMMPTYSKINTRYKQLSKIGAIEPFGNFVYEQFRNTYNLGKTIGKEMQDPILRPIGAKRLASVGALSAGIYGVSQYTKQKNGITPDKEQAIRNILPEWDKNDILIWNSPLQDGKVSYVNTSYLFPITLTAQALSSGIRASENGTVGDGAKEFATVFADQFLGEGAIGVVPLIEATINQKIDFKGNRLRRIAEEGENQLAKRSFYVYEKVFEPGFAKTVRNFYKANTDPSGDAGKIFSNETEMKRLMGYRENKLDIPKAVSYKLADLKNRWNSANTLYTTKGNRNKPELQAQEQQAFLGLVQEFRNIKQSAYTLGMTRSQFRKEILSLPEKYRAMILK